MEQPLARADRLEAGYGSVSVSVPPAMNAGSRESSWTRVFSDGEWSRSASQYQNKHDDGIGADLSNMFKGFFGMSWMYTAYAFSKAGLLRGTLGLIFIFWITEHCCNLIVKVKRAVMDRQHLPPTTPPKLDVTVYGRREPSVQTLGDLAREVLGVRMEQFVNISLVFTQFGYCVGYLIFLSQTLKDLTQSTGPVWRYSLIPIPFVLPLGLLRSVRSLAPFSNIANLSLLSGYIAVMAYIFGNLDWRITHPAPISSFPVFIGTMTAAVEGVALVIPIETSMKDKTKFEFILRVALISLFVFLLPIGVLGYICFGDNLQSIIINNVQGSSMVDMLKVLLCLGILFTYPLQISPVMHAVDSYAHGHFAKHVMVHDVAASDFQFRFQRILDSHYSDSDEESDDESGDSPRMKSVSLSYDEPILPTRGDSSLKPDLVGARIPRWLSFEDRKALKRVLKNQVQRLDQELVGKDQDQGIPNPKADADESGGSALGPPRNNAEGSTQQRSEQSIVFNIGNSNALPARPDESLRLPLENLVSDKDIQAVGDEPAQGNQKRKFPGSTSATELFPPTPMIHRRNHRDHHHSHHHSQSLFVEDPKSLTGRFLVVVLTAMVAIVAGKNFGLFMSLVGSLGASFVAYCAPALMHFVQFRKTASTFSMSLDVFVFLFGLGLAVFGTYTAVSELIAGKK